MNIFIFIYNIHILPHIALICFPTFSHFLFFHVGEYTVPPMEPSWHIAWWLWTSWTEGKDSLQRWWFRNHVCTDSQDNDGWTDHYVTIRSELPHLVLQSLEPNKFKRKYIASTRWLWQSSGISGSPYEKSMTQPGWANEMCSHGLLRESTNNGNSWWAI